MAAGGIAAGGWTLVGERGPELVNMPRGSQVYPNGQTRQMLRAGDTYNITVNTAATSGTYLADIMMARALAA